MALLSDQIAQLKQSADNFIGSQSGLVKNSISGASSSVPWNNSTSRFWAPMDIDPSRWDKLFPYRLVVIDAKTGQIVGGQSGSPSVKVISNEGNTIINFEPLGRKWVFRLPITPEQLSITDQFAINTSATLRG